MINPTDRLMVTLTAETWNLVMQVLSDAPFKVVAGAIQEIQVQCNSQQMQQGQGQGQGQEPRLVRVPDQSA